MKPNRRPAAFTLVELLAVVAIIALLIGILVPSVQSARNQAKKAKTQTLLSALGKSNEMFAGENKTYAKSSGGNPFEASTWSGGPSINPTAPLSGAQWLALQLMGADGRGFVQDNLNNDSNNDSEINHEDWRDWYDLQPSRTYVRNTYFQPAGEVSHSPESFADHHPTAGAVPAELTRGTSDWNNEKLPFFIDAWSYPILYYRANPAAQFALTTGSGTNIKVGRYRQEDNQAFTGGLNAGGWDMAGVEKPHLIKDLGFDPNNPTDAPAADTFMYAIFNRETFHTTLRGNQGRVWPHNADTFILWSPGLDGRWGTTDDIRNFDAGG